MKKKKIIAKLKKRNGPSIKKILTPGRETEVTVIFVDIEDSAGIANHYKTEDYREFLKEFHSVVKKVLENSKWEDIKNPHLHRFLGDEFIAFMPHEIFTEVEAIESALELAAKLKYNWYFSKFNQERLESDKEPIELNVGINSGVVKDTGSNLYS